MKPMETLQDLIEEAKSRTVCWAICIFAISYFLSHTSKSMWVNIPISALILVGFRYLSYEVELRWRVRPAPKPTYLLHLEKKQLSVDDPRLSNVVSSLKWRRKIDSPIVEAAIEGFIDKILQDFVVDLWYSSITPDKETPELIHSLMLDVLGDVSGRLREINLVDLLTRNLVDLVGNQLDLFRKNQSEIGVGVMGTLSSEERDERLKHHLIASKELHPALFSPESEQKVLQRIIGGVLALVLKPHDAQCPLVRCFSRELLTSLVLQPVMNFASPWYINELIEYIFLDKSMEANADKSNNSTNLSYGHTNSDHSIQSDDVERQTSASNAIQLSLLKGVNGKSVDDPDHDHQKKLHKDCVPKQADWAMVLDAATKRRTQVLEPENLENMWTKGRNYQKKTAKLIKAGTLSGSVNTIPSGNNVAHMGSTANELVADMNEAIKGIDEKYMVHLMQGSRNEQKIPLDMLNKQNKGTPNHDEKGEENSRTPSRHDKVHIKRSGSISDIDTAFTKTSGDTSCSKVEYDPNHIKYGEEQNSEVVSHNQETLHVPKIKCRVIGAYFEKLGSKSFAVYSIAVTDTENKTWFVKRRYRNFERLHRHLKDIPNYSLHLPPKRFLSSSIDDYFVHQRCILLDKYLQDLLSIANIAEQHEVWDFLSESSKSYSFGKSTSVMKTLAVNVDDAMDDIVRQFKGVSDGLRRKVVGSSTSNSSTSLIAEKSLAISWNEEEMHNQITTLREMESSHSLSDEEVHDDDSSTAVKSGWHSDNELNSKSFPPRIVYHNEKTLSLEFHRNSHSERNDRINPDGSKSPVADFQDPLGMPPEWTPPNVSVPLLNLVDKVFQLNRRGWLRRQVYWMSKQVLQLMMEDAIDDWILRQIHLLRRDDVIAQGVLWVQDVLWPNGKFFKELESSQGKKDDNMSSQRPSQTTNRANSDSAHGTSSFEMQLEAARRASAVKKLILGGAPTTLVSLIGPSQYKRSAKDIYYFLQSTICIKQLAYSILEMVLVSIFPELRDLMIDIHERACYQTL